MPHALNRDDPERDRASARTFPGNFLFSIGPNAQGGGTHSTRGHLDVPIRDCSLEFDGELLIDAVKLVDPAMQVALERRWPAT